MARGDKTTDILKAIAEDASSAAGPDVEESPDFVEIGGVKYYKEGTQTGSATPKPVKKLWVNPRRPNDPPVERYVEQVAINVAPYADRITLDGVIYLAGRIYEVPTEVAATMREICQRTWQHEASTGGAYSHGTNQSVRGTRSQTGVAAPGIGFG